MTKRIILASHGGLSEGMYNSVKMIVGDVGDVVWFSLQPGENNLKIANDIVSYIYGNNADQYIIICDLLGGSVSNTVSRLSDPPRITVINGMNMGLVIGLLLEPSPISDLRIKELVEESKLGIDVVNLEENGDNVFDEEGIN